VRLVQVPGQEAVEHVDLVDLVDHVGGGPEHSDVEQGGEAGAEDTALQTRPYRHGPTDTAW